MIKKLLSVSLFAAFALTASAYEVGEYIYTKTAKYQITGDNLVVNGKFQGPTGFDGGAWKATNPEVAPLEAVFLYNPAGPNGSGSQKVIEGQNTLDAGMYQSIKIDQGGIYVVSFKTMATTAGFTDLDLTGGNTNYINAYYNTNDTISAVDGTNLLFGENGVGGGYQFTFSTEGFIETVFAIDAPAEGYIRIDFRGLNDGVEIADVECHLAQEVYDSRIAQRRVDYINRYFELMGDQLAGREFGEDLEISIAEVKAGIEANATPEEMATLMENMEGVWTEFVGVNFGNVIDFVPTTDGRASEGNHSANWMQWTGKYNKLNSNYNGKAPWEWTTDRWCHKQTEVGSPMSLQWMRGVGGPYNNIATLTVSLKPGEYLWGVSGEGGMMTLNKNRWARSWGNENAGTQLFFGADTTEVFILDPAIRNDYVYKFTVTGEGEQEVRLGLICNTTTEHKDGFDVNFYSPVLFKLLNEGELSPEQELYLKTVATQIENLQARLDVANGYIADATRPWVKEALSVATDAAQEQYNAWAAMTQDDILASMDGEDALGNIIATTGIDVLNDAIDLYVQMNSPLTNIVTSIGAAQQTMWMRVYSSSSKMGDLSTMINEAIALYEAKMLVAFSSADSLALEEKKAALEALVVEFKKAIDATPVVDINFGTQEAPATFVEWYFDEEGIEESQFGINGALGMLNVGAKYRGYTSSANDYELGLNGADSLGILRVGGSDATVDFTGTPAKSTDIVNIQFDYYFGNLTTKSAGFYVLGAEKMVEEVAVRDTICGLFCSKYDGTSTINTFNINFGSHITAVGSSGNDNAAIAAESNKTHFDIVLDYGKKMMYCTTSGDKGTNVTEEVALPEIVPARFVLASNYATDARRCWFDNLLIQNIAAGNYDAAIKDVVVNNANTKNNAIYNLAGQRLAAPVKGQIYIKGGKKYIAK